MYNKIKRVNYIKMLKIFFIAVGIFVANNSFANCFIAKEVEKYLINEGECKKQYSPCSSFKIPLSLIGYDVGILLDENNPVLEFKKGYTEGLDAWKSPQTPKSWMRYSCVWYSQVLTKKLGLNKFREYITKLGYGNLDISGDSGKNNGLTNSWLSSSLEISPVEQMEFVNKFIELKLPVSKKLKN
jgi:beta-lactamase class D